MMHLHSAGKMARAAITPANIARAAIAPANIARAAITPAIIAVCLVVCLAACSLAPYSAVFAQEQTAGLKISSKAAILMDYSSGEILYEKNSHAALPPASVTKVMTLALALEALQDGRAKLDTLVSTSEFAASMGGTQIWLETGEQMSYNDLLYAIAVGSANDAAVAVAEYLSGSIAAFADVMNSKAKTLGMKDTHFSNPNGLPPSELGMTEKHVTSAYDLAVLARWAWKLPMFAESAGTWGPVVMRAETKRQPELWTFNKMLKTYSGMDGIKTGMTGEAGFCLAATAMRNNVRLIAIALGAATSTERNKDIATMFDYGFAQIQAVKVAVAGEKVGDVSVQRGKVSNVAVAPVHDVVVTARRGQKLEPVEEIVTVKKPSAPIKKGQAIAQLVVKVNGKEAARVDLVAMADVQKSTVLQMMLQGVQHAFGAK